MEPPVLKMDRPFVAFAVVAVFIACFLLAVAAYSSDGFIVVGHPLWRGLLRICTYGFCLALLVRLASLLYINGKTTIDLEGIAQPSMRGRMKRILWHDVTKVKMTGANLSLRSQSERIGLASGVYEEPERIVAFVMVQLHANGVL
jgi:hypothetical protein